MLDHQPVGCAVEDDELRAGDELGELLGVTHGREDVLASDDDQRRHRDSAELGPEGVIGAEDGVDLPDEGVGRDAAGAN